MEFLKLVVLQLSELNVKVILSVTLIPQVIERCQVLNNSVRCHKEQSSLLLHKYLTARKEEYNQMLNSLILLKIKYSSNYFYVHKNLLHLKNMTGKIPKYNSCHHSATD